MPDWRLLEMRLAADRAFVLLRQMALIQIGNHGNAKKEGIS